MENLVCDCCACKHNINGCKCDRQGIRITTGEKSDSAHYCADFED